MTRVFVACEDVVNVFFENGLAEWQAGGRFKVPAKFIGRKCRGTVNSDLRYEGLFSFIQKIDEFNKSTIAGEALLNRIDACKKNPSLRYRSTKAAIDDVKRSAENSALADKERFWDNSR